MSSGTIQITWDADGRLKIQTSLPMADSHNRKAALKILLDAALAINDQGSSLVMPDRSSVRLLSGAG